MKTYLITIRPSYASHKRIPNVFAAVKLIETPRAYYFWGHGTVEAAQTGRCCACGRTLTHPVSITLGIGPVCGQHYWNWELVGGFSEENIERLKQEIGHLYREMKVDQWIPKSVVQNITDCTEQVTPPETHPMLKSTQKRSAIKSTELMRYDNGDYGIKVEFPYNPDDVFTVKRITGRRFNSTEKYWTVPLNPESVETLEKGGWSIDPRITKFLERATIVLDDLSTDVDIPGLRMPLFEFQKLGVSFLEHRNGRALIGDEMGLGKTAQALAYLQLHPEIKRTIIVVPASLKLNWKKEISMWMDGTRSVQILKGQTPYNLLGDILIINYDILNFWVEALINYEPQVLIADECHYVKNNSAKRTKAMKKLAKHTERFIGLSGTPIVNRPVEFFNAIKMIDGTMFPNFWDYVHKYCAARHNGYGWDFSGSSNTQQLHELLTSTIMIRRKKRDVLKDLPDKIYSFVPCHMDDRGEYDIAEHDFVGYVTMTKGTGEAERVSRAEELAKIEKLKQLAVRGKLIEAIGWIQDFISSDEQIKLVVFATHRFVIDEILKFFGEKAVKVDGGVSLKDRQKAVERFQNDPDVQLFIGNIKAAGVGLTLTAASNVAFLELPWTPGDLVQAEDRCHRIGQKDSVNVYYLLAQNTIEERIARLLDSKRKVLESVLDGAVPEDSSLLGELINDYYEYMLTKQE